MKRLYCISILLCLLTSLPTPSLATKIYRETSRNGDVSFSGSPQANSVVIELPSANSSATQTTSKTSPNPFAKGTKHARKLQANLNRAIASDYKKLRAKQTTLQAVRARLQKKRAALVKPGSMHYERQLAAINRSKAKADMLQRKIKTIGNRIGNAKIKLHQLNVTYGAAP